MEKNTLKSNFYFDLDFKKAAELIRDSVSVSTIFIVGNCKIIYDGRASSYLDFGERVILIKKDGSLLVHRSIGVAPQNWQPPGCKFKISFTDDEFKLESVRLNPREVLRLIFKSIRVLGVLDLKDDAEFILNASEKDIQRAILIKPDLIEEGFQIIVNEKRVKPGFIDVYGVDKDGNHVVVELKRKTAGKNAVIQLSKYINELQSSSNVKVRGILAAPRLTKEARLLLETLGLEYKLLNLKKCNSVLRKSAKLGKITDFILE
ncbi:MAG: endonuclease NucS [Candidatus Odinarchaeia archaeon]